MKEDLKRFLDFLDSDSQSVESENEGSIDPEVIRIAEIWADVIPKNNFGILESITVFPLFRKNFQTSLENNYQSLENTAPMEVRSSVPYTIFEPSYNLKGSAIEVKALHQPESITIITRKLQGFLITLEAAKISTVLKDVYKEKATAWLRFCQTVAHIGKTEFTKLAGQDRLNILIDINKTVEKEEVILKYEEDAKNVLELSKLALSERLTDKFINYFNLTDHELQPELSLSILETSETLTPVQTQHLFIVLLKRLGIFKNDTLQKDGWEVITDSNTVATTINAKGKRVIIPESENYTTSGVEYLLAHEFIHILRGENGSRQDISIMQEGTEGYEPTDEGLAVLSELLAGQQFGHERQAKMAARYYAIALSLKTKTDIDGNIVSRYSHQEIYNVIRDYGISAADAGDILWRIQRGTSLKREVLPITISNDQEEKTVFITETYPKDTIYFEGQMALFNLFKEKLPIEQEDRKSDAIEPTRDFNMQFMTKIGKAIARVFYGSQVESEPDINTKLANYLHQLGRDATFDLLDYFLVGKIPFDKISDTTNMWYSAIKRDGLISYKQLFIPYDSRI